MPTANGGRPSRLQSSRLVAAVAEFGSEAVSSRPLKTERLGVEIFESAQYFQAMSTMTVEQIAEEALGLPSEARALLADRLVESLDPAEDGHLRQLWATEARRRRDDVRSGRVKTIPGEEALARVRRAVAR